MDELNSKKTQRTDGDKGRARLAEKQNTELALSELEGELTTIELHRSAMQQKTKNRNPQNAQDSKENHMFQLEYMGLTARKKLLELTNQNDPLSTPEEREEAKKALFQLACAEGARADCLFNGDYSGIGVRIGQTVGSSFADWDLNKWNELPEACWEKKDALSRKHHREKSEEPHIAPSELTVISEDGQQKRLIDELDSAGGDPEKREALAEKLRSFAMDQTARKNAQARYAGSADEIEKENKTISDTLEITQRYLNYAKESAEKEPDKHLVVLEDHKAPSEEKWNNIVPILRCFFAHTAVQLELEKYGQPGVYGRYVMAGGAESAKLASGYYLGFRNENEKDFYRNLRNDEAFDDAIKPLRKLTGVEIRAIARDGGKEYVEKFLQKPAPAAVVKAGDQFLTRAQHMERNRDVWAPDQFKKSGSMAELNSLMDACDPALLRSSEEFKRAKTAFQNLKKQVRAAEKNGGPEAEEAMYLAYRSVKVTSQDYLDAKKGKTPGKYYGQSRLDLMKRMNALAKGFCAKFERENPEKVKALMERVSAKQAGKDKTAGKEISHSEAKNQNLIPKA